jgi:hypothetical protein
VIPIATIAPAIPARFSANPTEPPSNTIASYVITAAMASDATTTMPRPR